MWKAKNVNHGVCEVNVGVETNCPKGGDAGHGGFTVIEFTDEGGTNMDAVVEKDSYGYVKNIRLVFKGDIELNLLLESLDFVSKELKRQLNNNLKRSKGMELKKYKSIGKNASEVVRYKV